MKLHILTPAAALVLAAAASSAARAQQPGDMVRVSAGPQRQEGIAVAMEADGLQLAVFPARPEVHRIDVSAGRRVPDRAVVRGMVRGLAYGAAAGAVAGFLFGDFCHVEATSAPTQGTAPTTERRGCGATGRMIGTAVGAVGGGAIGMGAGALWVNLRL